MYLIGSAPCRAVQMTAAAVGAKLNLKLTDLMSGEHLTPEYLKVSYNQVFFCICSRTICLRGSFHVGLNVHELRLETAQHIL